MKPVKFVLFALTVILFVNAPSLRAQVQSTGDMITPAPQFQDHGGLTPWFWIGIKSVFSGGYNLETGGAGFRNYGGDNNTYASFNLAFVDSHYQTPKFYEVPRNLDPQAWSGKFKLLNFTSRINSWSRNVDAIENNRPAWLAEISGKGVHIGFFTQAAEMIGFLDDPQDSTNSPRTSISGGNMVLPLGDNDLGKYYYDKPVSGVATVYSGTQGLWYTGYEKPDIFNLYLTMLSEGDVNSTLSENPDGTKRNDGFAGALDFGVYPLGLIAGEENPFIINVTGNVIGGVRFETSENIGFGLKAEPSFWLGRDNFVLTPVAAFDGKVDVDNKFTGKGGFGLVFQFSGMRWLTSGDDWNDMASLTNASYRYENSKVLKYAHAQIYGAWSEADDLDMVFKVEEPDGDAGFHDKLGFMAELRWYNLTEKTKKTSWEIQGRVSYDFVIKNYLVTPYVRSYLNKDAVLKLRLGAQANIIPYTGFELAYTTANLNRGADNFSYNNNNMDKGRIELIIILQSDNVSPKTPKRMDFWDYNKYANGIPD